MEPRILMLDTEFMHPKAWRGFSAEVGLVYCMCSKWYGKKKVIIHRVDDYGINFFKAEKYMLKEMKETLEQADIWVSWYGIKCDIPQINTRLMHHGLGILPNIKHIDLWKTCKYKLALGSNSMKNVSEWLGFAERKTPLKLQEWYLALHGNKKAMNSIVRHCIADIRVLEEGYERLLPLVSPRVSLNAITGDKDACPKCGVRGKLQKRGWNYAQVMRTRRFQCTACGSWLTGKRERVLPVGSLTT